MFFFICLVVTALLLTVYLQKDCSRFSKYGVKYKRPVPFLGNYSYLALKKCHYTKVQEYLYYAFPSERFVGRFELMRPVIMIRDPELIKKVFVEDYEHFLDHRTLVDETVDPLFGRNLFSLKGQEWKDMRSTLSPAFTGSRMRSMVPFMVDVSDQMIAMLKKKINLSDSGYIEVDTKDLTTRYTNDVMASCGFGLKVNSHTDTDNEFYLHAKSTGHINFRRVMVYLGYTSFPYLMKKLNIKMMNETSNEYFKMLFSNTIMERQRNNIFRPDIIDLLMKAKKAWSDTDLVAQAVFFFLASFETISSAMSFLLYELALNPDVQDRLFKEFRDSEAKNEGFDYEGLKYLDMVVSELLRLWPLGVDTDRICTKDYNLGKPNDNATSDYIIKKGELISVPVWSIHHDPKYFSDPAKFDPERFSAENRANIKPYTNLPFGSGPRSCVASRFVLYQMKVMIYHLLLHFEMSPAEKTRIPVELKAGSLLLDMEGGSWIRFSTRV